MDVNLLPENIKAAFDEQRAMFQEMLNSFRETNAALKESLRQKDILIAALQELIACLNKVIFGSRSEKTIYVDPGQKSLFGLGEDNTNALVASDEQAIEKNTVHVPAHERTPKRSLKEIYDKLPHKEEIIDLPESERFDTDGRPLVRVGKVLSRREVRSIPAQHWCVDIYTVQYKVVNPQSEVCRFVSPDVPAPLIEHSFASASTVSLIISNKYFAGLPLYRQEQIFKQQGFPLSRNVMANWMITVSELYLERIYLRLCKLIVEQPVIHADETPIQVLKEPGRRAQQKSYMWVYATSKRAKIQIRCFSYENSRSGERANRFLKDFNGILISDGYGGYLKVDVIRAGCWAHMRRKWTEAIPKGVPSENSTAAIGLKYCTQLFEFERSIENLSNEERAIERQKKHIDENKSDSENENKPDSTKELPSAKEILQEYWKWIGSLGDTTGKLKTAVKYALNQKQYLETFLEHGDIEISNNQVENAIRPFVVGRKGWLFSDTPQGARASAVIYSLIETAKANNIKPAEWLEHILLVSSDRFAHIPNYEVDDLLPWSDEMQSRFRL